MKALLKSALDRMSGFLDDTDDTEEPFYDPVHIGGAVVITLAALGIIYWLLWTLLVYEGGIFLKLRALGEVLFTSKTFRDLGYEGYPYALGAFEGWIGNSVALLLTLAAAAALYKLYHDGGRR